MATPSVSDGQHAVLLPQGEALHISYTAVATHNNGVLCCAATTLGGDWLSDHLFCHSKPANILKAAATASCGHGFFMFLLSDATSANLIKAAGT